MMMILGDVCEMSASWKLELRPVQRTNGWARLGMERIFKEGHSFCNVLNLQRMDSGIVEETVESPGLRRSDWKKRKL